MTTSAELTTTLEKKPAKPETFPAMLQAWKPQIEAALPRHLNADRMARICLTCFRQTPKLGECEPLSVFAAVIQAAQLGLEPGLNGRAYILPYRNRKTGTSEAQFIPGWKGLVELANRSGRVSVWTGAVFEGDGWKWATGTKPFIEHMPGTEDDPTQLTNAYAVGWIKGAEWPVIEVWPLGKIIRHRDRYNRVGDDHYSYKHLEMYARKVVLLQVLKYLPSTPELEAAIILNDQAEIGAQRLTLEDAIKGEYAAVPELPPAQPPPPVEAPPSAVTATGGALTAEAAIARVNAMTDAETLALWADDPPAEIKQDEEFKSAYVARQQALKDAAGRKGRK